MTGQTSPTFGASAAYWSRKLWYAAFAAAPPMSCAPGIKQPSVSVIAPGGAVWKVPTSPLTVPPVQDTAALARTENPADAPDPPEPPCSDREKLGIALMLDVGLPDVASLHAAPSSAVATSRPVTNLE